MKNTYLLSLSIFILLLIACEPNNIEVTNDCKFDPRRSCNSFSFSIVNKDTYENLVGTNGQLIHPDSIVITNTRGNVMDEKPLGLSDGWYTIESFSPFEELYCFNQCKLDSAFTRTYFVYLGNGDTDTMEVYFPAHSEKEEVFYNGLNANIPDDIHDSLGSGYSVYWFRKTISP